MLAKELKEQVEELIKSVGNQPVIFRIENGGEFVDVEDLRINLHKSKIVVFIQKDLRDLAEENERLTKRASDSENESEELLQRLSDVEEELEEYKEKLEQIKELLDS